MNLTDAEEAEVFDPQRDLEFELVDEEKAEEIVPVQKMLTLSQIR